MFVINNIIIYVKDRAESLQAILSKNSTSIPIVNAITREELGSYDTIELEVMASHNDSISIPEDGSLLLKDDNLGWREYHISKLVDSDKDNQITKHITGELSSVELLDAKFESSDFLEGSIGDMAIKLLEGTRWTVGNVDLSIATIVLGHKGTAELKHKSVLECLYSIAGKSDCDMYFSYKVDGNKVVERKVNFIKKLGSENGKIFSVGKDVISVEREIDYSNIKTAIIPTGDVEEKHDESPEHKAPEGKDIENVSKELTIENIVWKKPDNPADKPKGQKWIGDDNALARWGRKDSEGHLIHSFTHVHFNVKDDDELMRLAWMELGKYKNPKITYKLDVIDLYNLTGESKYKDERVVIGDFVSVIDNYFPKKMAVKTRVIKIERDLIDPSNTKILLGDLFQTYTSKSISTESMIASKLDTLANKTGKVVTAIVTDRQTNNYGSTEPKNPAKGDIWFRPHPKKPDEKQMLIWDGQKWVVQLDTSVNTEAYELTRDIVKEFEKSKKEIRELSEHNSEAIEKSNVAIEDTVKKVNEIADKTVKENQELLKKYGTLDDKITKQDLLISKQKDELLVQANKVEKQTSEISQIRVDSNKVSSVLSSTTNKVSSLENNKAELETKMSAVVQKVDSLATLVKTVTDSSQVVQLSDQLRTTVKKVDTIADNMFETKNNLLVDSMDIKLDKSDTGIPASSYDGMYYYFRTTRYRGTVYNDTDIKTAPSYYRRKGGEYTLSFDISSSGSSFDVYIKSDATSNEKWQGPFRVEGKDGMNRVFIQYVQEGQSAGTNKPFGIKIADLDSLIAVTYGKFKLVEGHAKTQYDNIIDTLLQKGELAQQKAEIVKQKSEIIQLSDRITSSVSNKAEKSEVIQLAGVIQSTVKKGDVISAINQSPEKITLDARLIHITGDTKIDTAAISSAAIRNLSADKITTGTLDARRIRVIGLDAGSIATGTLDAIHIKAHSITGDHLATSALQVGLNNFGKNIKMSPDEITFYKNGNLTGKVNEDGQQFWYGSRFIGSVGERGKLGSPDCRGISNQLSYDGDYITWSYKDNSYSNAYTSMLTLDPKGKYTGYAGVHIDKPMWVKTISTYSGDIKVRTLSTPSGGGPVLTNEKENTGIAFTKSTAYLYYGNFIADLEKIAKFFTRLGSTDVYIPTNINSNGTVHTWKNFSI